MIVGMVAPSAPVEEWRVKRVLEYRVWSPIFYGNLCDKRETTVFHEYLKEISFALTDISESLGKPPGVYGRM